MTDNETKKMEDAIKDRSTIDLTSIRFLSKAIPYLTKRQFLDDIDISSLCLPSCNFKEITWSRISKVGKPIEEVLKIDNKGNCNYEGKDTTLPLDTPVSMNLWGFTQSFFDVLDKGMKEFLATADLSKDEYLVPRVVGDLVEQGKASVKVYLTRDKWSGITYREDLPGLKEAIKGYIDQGLYKGL